MSFTSASHTIYDPQTKPPLQIQTEQTPSLLHQEASSEEVKNPEKCCITISHTISEGQKTWAIPHHKQELWSVKTRGFPEHYTGKEYILAFQVKVEIISVC